MYIQQLQYFVLVAEKLNFSEAAKALYVSQSSLSYGIASLENELGFKLFNRTRQNVRLTDAGAAFYPDVKKMLNLFEASLEKARKIHAGTQGSLKIGFLRSILRDHFTEWIPAFRIKYPEIQVSVLELSPIQLNEGLLQGTIDIAFTRSFNVVGLPELTVENIYDTSCEIVMSKDNVLASMEELDFSRLNGVPLITMGSDTSPGWDTVVNTIFGKNGVTPNITYAAQSLDVILSMVICNAGIGLFNSPAHKLVDPHKVKAFDVPKEFATHHVVAAWNRDNRNPSIPLMLDVIKPFYG